MVNQSRIMTEQGDDINWLSANGDIGAGKGLKTKRSAPHLQLTCTADMFCFVSPSGLVTGSGIAALATVPGEPQGDVQLQTPHGIIDLGSAGLRGNRVHFVAPIVLNAFNVTANVVVGVPAVPTIPTAALVLTSTDAGRVAKPPAANDTKAEDRPSIIIVEVLGYGGGSGDVPPQQLPDEDRKKNDGRRSQLDGGYNPYSPIHLLGNGELTETQKRKLSQDEMNNLEKVIEQSASR